MPRLSPPLRRSVFVVLLMLASGFAWLACWQVARSIFGFTELNSGITLLYLPAGVRLVILLVAGAWGAIGIAMAFPLALFQVFPDLSWAEIMAYSAITGFVPYAAVQGSCRVAGISRDLGTLRPIHLPLLAAAVSVAGALAYTAALVAFGRFAAGDFVADATAMAAGDFLGCFSVVMLARLVFVWWRKAK